MELRNNAQSIDQEHEAINDEDFFDDFSSEERELIKRALLIIERAELIKLKEIAKDIENSSRK